MNYKIRRSVRDDCFAIAHVVTIAWQETYRGIINDDFLDNLPNTEKARRERLFNHFDKEDNHQFVLEIDNQVVGFVNVGLTKDLEFENQGEIFALYIINKYKGYSFGRKLTEIGIDELKKIGCTKMIIGCLDGNSSNEYYKHIGGKFIKTRIFKLPNQELIENVYYFDNI
ncbi:MAG: GNAT family N-acetyltransferase [Bacilli bacterium]|nr:GNAT family N-acetyltransferase [Bacilli bacterium]